MALIGRVGNLDFSSVTSFLPVDHCLSPGGLRFQEQEKDEASLQALFKLLLVVHPLIPIPL